MNNTSHRRSFPDNYRALLALIFFISISFTAVAQYDSTKVLQDQNAYGFNWKNGAFRGSFRIPTGDTITMAVADSGSLRYYNGGTFYWNGYYWVSSGTGGSGSTVVSDSAWMKTGNAGTTAGTNFIGTTDAVDLVFKRNNTIAGRIAEFNTSLGNLSLYSNNNTIGIGNTAIGAESMFENITGDQNIALGYRAGYYSDKSHRLYINSQTFISADEDSLKSIVHGIMNSDPSNQELFLNAAKVSMPYIPTGVGVYSVRADADGNLSLADTTTGGATSIYGEYTTTTFPDAALPTGYVKLDGAATITFNSPGISYTGGTGNKSDNYIRNTDTSSSNNYDYTWEFTLDTKFTDYSGQGKWFGKQSTDAVTIYNGIVYFGYGGSSSLARMKLALISGTGNGTAVDSSGTISMADGNDYRLTFSQRQNVILAKLSRLSSGIEVESVYINYRVSLATTSTVIPNVGVAAFGSLDATSSITVTNFTINYNDYADADAVVIGTSITQGYGASSMNNHYLEKAFKGSNHTFVNMGSGGVNFIDMLPIIPRAERLNPQYFIIETGVNDGSMAVSSFRGYLQQIFDSVVTEYGKPLIIIKDFENSTYDTIFYNFASEHPTTVTLIDPAAVMLAGDYIDGVHPNDKGYDIWASSLKQALPSLFGNEVVNDRYSLAGLNDVTISSVSDNQLLTYNSTTSKWNNETISGVVTLQPGAITQQTGNMGVTGYGEFNSGIGVGGASIATAKLRVLGNTVQDVTSLFENTNSAGTYPYFRISQMGVTAYGIADWPSASVLTSFSNGGLILGSYSGTIKFQTGTSHTTRGTWNSTGLSVGATSAPTSTLHSYGSFSTAYRAITALRTLDVTDHTINCTANTFTVTLPTAASITGREYTIVNSGSGTITIGTTSSQTFANINGTPTTLTINPVGSGAVGSYTVVSNGANWIVSSTLTNPAFTSQALTDGATITWNSNLGRVATVTLAGNRTLAISNPVANTYYQLTITQDGTGSRTITLPAGSLVIGGGAGAITLTTTAGAKDILTCFYDGTNYYWNYGLNYN